MNRIEIQGKRADRRHWGRLFTRIGGFIAVLALIVVASHFAGRFAGGWARQEWAATR